MQNENEVLASFLDAMRAHGIELDEPVVADGRRHRVKSNGERVRNAWYILHMDERPAGMFGHYRLLGGQKGVGWRFQGNAEPLTREQRREFARKMEEQRAARLKAEAEGYAKAAAEARERWAQSAPAPADFPYLRRKGVQPHCSRLHKGAGLLLVPALIDGQLASLQTITPDGEKRFLPGGKMAGAYCPLGPKPEAGAEVVVAEGFATAATIHEATGLTVFAAFNAGNLPAVSTAVHTRFPGVRIVVAADNDAWTPGNPGLTKATEAAKAVGGRVVAPTFASDAEDKPTDFNDYAARHGAEAVRRYFIEGEPTAGPADHGHDGPCADVGCPETPPDDAPPPGPADTDLPAVEFDDENLPFQILGVDRGTFYYLPHGSQQVVGLSASSHTKLHLMALAHISWWERRFPTKRGADWDAAANTLMRACERRGIYDAARVRGRGAWWDEGRPVLHLGDRLIVDNDVVPVAKMKSRFIYEAAAPMRADLSNPLTTAEANRLVKICEALAWERPVFGKLLAGWIMAALVCGALRWRPHIWITGGAGTGKSWTMDNIVRACLGDSGLSVQGESTEAGLRQTLGHDALAVTFDEAEQEKDVRAQQRIQNVLALARQASSESGAAIIKGSANGTATNYRVRSCFAYSSIGIGVEKYADASRISILSLDARRALKADEFEALKQDVRATITDEWVQRLHARAIRLIGVIRRNAETFAAAGAAHLGAQRMGDQIGALLAGAYALHSDREITPDAARQWIERQEWTDERSQQQARDELACVAHIAEAVVRVEGQDRSVAELVAVAVRLKVDVSGDITSAVAGDTLRRMGILVDAARVTVSNNHSGIARLLEKTPWARNWNRILERLDGAEKTVPKRFGSGTQSRGVSLPRSYFTDGEGEQEGF